MQYDHITENDVARFFNKFEMRKLSECWSWHAATFRSSKLRYGSFHLRPSRNHYANRVMWCINNGDIPNGMDVLHKCNNSLCVNPTHLKLGTHQDNMNDRKLNGQPWSTMKGEQHPNHKLTLTQVRQIRALWAVHECTQVQLAHDFGIDRITVQRILYGQSWRDSV